MFERFTHAAIKTIMLGQEESRRLSWNFFGTEELLLGLIAEEQNVAAKLLTRMGVDLASARQEVDRIVGHGQQFVQVELPFTPRAKRALELAWDEARQLEHNYIGCEHLLLGLIREGEGVAIQALQELGVDLSLLRKEILDSFEQKS